MNKVIKKYWEDQGKQIHCQDKADEEVTNVPIYYYLQGKMRVYVAAMYEGELVYCINQKWYREHDALRLIKK